MTTTADGGAAEVAMIDRPHETSTTGEGAQARATAGDERRRDAALLLLRVALLAVILVAGLAVASPGRRGAAEVASAGPAGCAADARGAVAGPALLPPGHPPVPGFRPPAPAIALPPGHPPISGWDGRPVPARPLAPTFQAPDVVEL